MPAASQGCSRCSMTLWQISHSSEFGVISNHAQGTHCTINQVINEDAKQELTSGVHCELLASK